MDSRWLRPWLLCMVFQLRSLLTSSLNLVCTPPSCCRRLRKRLRKLARVLTVAHPMLRREPQGIVARGTEVLWLPAVYQKSCSGWLRAPPARFLACLKDFNVFCDETPAGAPPTPEHFLVIASISIDISDDTGRVNDRCAGEPKPLKELRNIRLAVPLL